MLVSEGKLKMAELKAERERGDYPELDLEWAKWNVKHLRLG